MVNASKIKGRLREKDFTQSDLAKFMGIAPATVSQKINGVRPLTVSEAELIAKFLEISDGEYGSYFFNTNSA